MIVRFLDDHRVLDYVLELSDAAFKERLIVAGVFVLRRILSADKFLGVMYPLSHLGAPRCTQVLKLFFELLETILGKWYRLACHSEC